MSTFTHTIGKHTFTLHIAKSFEAAIKEHQQTDYTKVTAQDLDLYNMTDMNCDDNNLSDEEMVQTHKEFMDACEAYLSEIDVEKIVQALPKKKNGTFYRGRVEYPIKENMAYESEDEYGFRREALRWKLISDTEAELSIVSYVEKW